jgi:hypothetical protein
MTNLPASPKPNCKRDVDLVCVMLASVTHVFCSPRRGYLVRRNFERTILLHVGEGLLAPAAAVDQATPS